ncbi:glycosyltransferase [Ferruginibacter albus]|uniref:glycosyltransferase n=1 Tax=Ferruginibacter albus TaxID=2875540 RepID=UPI001CC61501|nr:glycosyltransferase [Ferruginibacter albus]UAY52217.1 glycosyltransferase [Ferruginibacter albus]
MKKKILHTTTRLVLGGGVEKNIYYTIAGLKDEFEFHLSCGADFNDDHFTNHPEIKIIICPHLINKISFVKDLKALWLYYRLIKKEKYDIVHTHETKASFITKLAAWLAGCPYIIYGLHGVTFNDPMSKLKRKFYILLEKLTIGCADLVVSVGHNTIDAYHAENIGTKIPYEVVRSGIDIEAYMKQAITNEEAKKNFRSSLGIKEEDIVLINVGRFSFSKAQRYSIQAFAQLKKKYNNLRLLLIGEGELLTECKTLVKNLGLDDNSVVFLGYQRNVPEFLSVSNIFMFTSLREGLPRVIVEASLLQIPVVTFSVEGANEVLEHEKTGFIVKQGDVDQLIYYAEQLILHPDLRIRFGQLSCSHVKENWDSHLMTKKLQEIYNRNTQ